MYDTCFPRLNLTSCINSVISISNIINISINININSFVINISINTNNIGVIIVIATTIIIKIIVPSVIIVITTIVISINVLYLSVSMVIITNTIVIKLSISSMNSIIISIMISNVNLLVESTNEVSQLQKTEHNNAPPFVFLIICVPWSSWSWTGRVFLIRHHSLFIFYMCSNDILDFPPFMAFIDSYIISKSGTHVHWFLLFFTLSSMEVYYQDVNGNHRYLNVSGYFVVNGYKLTCIVNTLKALE